MANLRRQKEALVSYFEAGCKAPGKLTVGLEVEHFMTGTDGSPVSFAQAQQVMQALQQTGDVPVVMDGEYVGFYNDAYAISLEPACQLEISVLPQPSVSRLMAVYDGFAARMHRALEQQGLRGYNLGYHPTRRAAAQP